MRLHPVRRRRCVSHFFSQKRNCVREKFDQWSVKTTDAVFSAPMEEVRDLAPLQIETMLQPCPSFHFAARAGLCFFRRPVFARHGLQSLITQFLVAGYWGKVHTHIFLHHFWAQARTFITVQAKGFNDTIWSYKNDQGKTVKATYVNACSA